MSWKYHYPCPSDFDSEEDYLAACEQYEDALSDYIDEQEEERHNI